jgi:glyoxylase-like metal-dependent hydrolase (beta-lactamase superfamily II)
MRSPTILPLRTPFAVGRVNCYLLLGDPLTIVDPGPNSAETRRDLVHGLAALGLQVEDIELVVVTHQHFDHIGNVRYIVERSNCSVAAHELLGDYLLNYEASIAAEDDYQVEIMRLHGVPDELIDSLRKISEAYRRFGDSVAVDMPLADGDLLKSGGTQLRVHARPGHSPSDTVFVDEADATALVGDHLIARISSNPIVHRPLTGSIDARTRSSTLATYAQSLQQTAALPLTILYSGHGDPIRDHRKLISERLAQHDDRKEVVRAQFERGPRRAYDVARSLWPGVPLDQTYLILSEVLGAIDLLLMEGRISVHESDLLGLEYSAV